MNLTYKNAAELLQSQGKFYINLSLERIQKLLSLFNNPQNALKIVHVAGTNGKGSVSSIIANILEKAGYKTGLYTSPHLINYTERIKINSKEIEKDKFAKYVETICKTADNNDIELTEFEILTAAMYKYFFDEKVDIAIVETGLGGRFDATNTAENKLISVITSISFDHTDRLGSTINEIAQEKAGIINNNSITVISENNNGLEVILQAAKENNSEVFITKDVETHYSAGKNYIVYGQKNYEFGLLGLYQNKNAALAFKTIEILNNIGFKISDEALKEGLKTVKWSARLDYNSEKNIITDGAHNPDAALELKKSLDYYFKGQKRIFIYSTLKTKDYVKIAQILFNSEDLIYYYEFDHKDSVNFDQYREKVFWLKNLYKLNKEDLNEILERKELKIVTGSLYMIGDFYKRFNPHF